ncbi:helix-turn-helix transcriptional regulator [Streptomyces verrucosisporus]|uniref:helix-turn-helix transcriptional regulator n=1 Tax=Streptomyces verrucosisporus TaxID=1695161 RepID=UPI0019D2EED3|nr:helix-turn-helix transcriptional regulator [Streptomyces verrucosisporus]MBN3932340.1 helix-turn-helix transcriptional regulator [Streptomyces verrucosisporus]
MCRPAWRRALVRAQRLSEFTRIRRVRDRIDREYARPLDVEALAREAGMPVAHLGRWFRLAYGRSPHDYLTARRAEHAAAARLRGGPGVAGTAGVRLAAGRPPPGVPAALPAGPAGGSQGAHRARRAPETVPGGVRRCGMVDM